MRRAAPVLAAVCLAAAWWLYRRQDATGAAPGEAAQLPADLSLSSWLIGQAETAASDLQSAMTTDAQARTNEAAFLAVIRHAEGTAGPNGYRTLFGGSLFASFNDHPRRAVQFTDKLGRRLWTSAAGAYQFMAASPLPGGGSTRVNTWDRIKARLSLPDFSPASQDAAALELVREAGALADVRAGRFPEAVSKVRGIWASLPGAGYAQPEKTLAELASVWTRNGGALA